jgi:hypothetical protein
VTEDANRRAIVDREQLRLLAIGYWILAAISAFYAAFTLVSYAFLAKMVPYLPDDIEGAGPNDVALSDADFAWFILAFGLVLVFVAGAMAVLQALAGVWIRRRQPHTACLVVAGISCLAVPIGTVLGVISFVVLLRPTVAALFRSLDLGADPMFASDIA